MCLKFFIIKNIRHEENVINYKGIFKHVFWKSLTSSLCGPEQARFPFTPLYAWKHSHTFAQHHQMDDLLASTLSNLFFLKIFLFTYKINLILMTGQLSSFTNRIGHDGCIFKDKFWMEFCSWFYTTTITSNTAWIS